MQIRIGSRGSALALWQATHIAAKLREVGHDPVIEVIRTTGDRLQGVAFNKVGTKGMFTKEIEEALLAGRVDLAVHSLKDLPTELHPAFTLAALPPRADPRDAFVSENFESFASLPPGARVGTSSLRRQSQLRAHRRDLEYIEFRGNVDTRLRKLMNGEAEACVLACAGLDRLDRTALLRERLPAEVVCPAAGQGALGIEVRAGDETMLQALHFLDDPPTRFAVSAERAALHALGGGCQVPIGIYCQQYTYQHSMYSFKDSLILPAMQHKDQSLEQQAHSWQISGSVSLPGGGASVRITLEHRTEENPNELGRRLAEELLRQGAGALLAG